MATNDTPTLSYFDRAALIDNLESELVEWAQGKRSHTSSILGYTDEDPGQMSALLVLADAAEVQKLSQAILALTAIQNTYRGDAANE